MPKFFIPNQSIDDQESVYAQLAKSVSVAMPVPGKRIYSIRFKHNGIDWTATVGETLTGKSTKTVGRGMSKREVSSPVSDTALVMAIFSGNPFFVFTDSGLAQGSRSGWQNPFMAGIPNSVSYFHC